MEIFLAALLLVAVSVWAQVELPSPVPTFVPGFTWKVRYRHEQAWTQVVETRTTVFHGKREVETIQRVTLKNEVVEIGAAGALIRSTFASLDEQTTPRSSGQRGAATKRLRSALVGGSFSWRQGSDGRVFDVRGGHGFASLENLQLPATALRVGGAYTFSLRLPWALYGLPITVRRTLTAFDGKSAVWKEGGRISIASTQLSGAIQRSVLLTHDAAQMYVAQSYHTRPNAQTVYLSRNGGFYYRDPINHQAFFLHPPVNGIRVEKDAAAPFQGFIGYDNRSTGQTVQRFIESGDDLPYVEETELHKPIKSRGQKSFASLHGTYAGSSIVSAESFEYGLVVSSHSIIQVTGKTTVVEADGRRKSTPFRVKIERTNRVPVISNWFDSVGTLH